MVCAFLAAVAWDLAESLRPHVGIGTVYALALWAMVGTVLGRRYAGAERDDAERMRRREASVVAFRFVVLAASVAVFAMICYGYSSVALDLPNLQLTYGQLMPIVATIFILVISLPVLVYAWCEPA